jgi:hypothetical protein
MSSRDSPICSTARTPRSNPTTDTTPSPDFHAGANDPLQQQVVVVNVLANAERKYRVPLYRIRHLPSGPQRARVLCPFYDPERPEDSCPMGNRCHHVHADIRGLVVVCAHINYAWRSLADVTYARHAPGWLVHVAAPNTVVDVDVIDTGSLLVTKALESNRRPLTHCAHYYLNRRCNLGPDCRFVHAVFVSTGARSRQRAPAPVQLGRKRVARPEPPLACPPAVVAVPYAVPPPVSPPPASAPLEQSRASPTQGQPSSSPSLATPTISFNELNADGTRWKHNPYFDAA